MTDMKISNELELLETSILIPYVRNSRTHSDAQVQQIASSIKEFGFTNPILIDETNGIIAGHGRLLAAQLLKIKSVPCIRLGYLSESQKRAYVIADNKLALNAGWDDELLSLELKDLQLNDFDLSLTGFNEDELAKLLVEAVEGQTDPDDVPEIQETAITVLGDIWTLGRHRLMCGNCRLIDDIDKLFDKQKMNLIITSPPYASQRNYDLESQFKPIQVDEFVNWYKDIAINLIVNLEDDGSYFCNIKPNADGLKRELYVFDLVLAHVRDWGWNFADEFCWERSGIPQRVARRFKNQFEPIYHFTKGEWKFRPDEVKHESKSVPQSKGKGAGNTNAAMRQGHVSAVFGNEIESGFAYPGNRLPVFQSEALGHPAAFPVKLPEFFIKAYTDLGDKIFDPFMGSGSTLIAADKNNRIAFGTEISPTYTDLIIKRWQNFSGKKAVHSETGKTFEEIADERSNSSS